MNHRRLGGAVAAVLLLSACGSSTTEAEAPTPTTSQPADTSAVSADRAAFDAAIVATAEASQRSFASLVRVATSNGTIEVRLEGTRSGQDRVLTVSTDQGAVTYEVTDGKATIDRGDGPSPIELTEVPEAPSLTALQSMQDVSFPKAGEAVGTIDAAAVLGGDAPAGPVQVTVNYRPGGFVQGFQMAASDNSFTATVTFTDIMA